MTACELLELAAKAAGYRIESRSDGAYAIERNGGWWPWNPLTDDGDALRLASQTGQTVYTRREGELNHLTATRRAIVRAAAEVGKAIP